MFTSPRPNLYESSNGFTVEVLGTTGLIYSERGWKMFVDSEVSTGNEGMIVYSSSIKRWEEPHTTDAISDAEKQRILNNIQDAFRFQGFEIHII